LILDGFGHRYKLLLSGQRQILAVHIPGDIPDLQSLHLDRMDHSLAARTRLQAAYIFHASLRAFVRERPHLGEVLWRDTLVDASITREWVANIGRRTAPERIAHLLCETVVRLEAAGLAKGNVYGLPMTQAELADTTGLSQVHVNPSLQHLRQAGLIYLRAGALTVLDRGRLEAFGTFDPAYLHLRRAPESEGLKATLRAASCATELVIRLYLTLAQLGDSRFRDHARQALAARRAPTAPALSVRSILPLCPFDAHP
jgi:CRP-like cAMP-binding protein